MTDKTSNAQAQNELAIDFEDVKSAALRLEGRLWPTPLLRAPVLDLMCGKQVWLKPECTQKVGAFKYRGAYNRLSKLSKLEQKQGVVAFSSGNHARGVARAAKELGLSAIIVMPEDAPRVKVDGVKADGGEIVFYDRRRESREELAAAIARRDGRTIVPSYDDPDIIAGQGTAGLEVAESAARDGFSFDALITPMGGGGLAAGIGTAFKTLSPQTRIFGAEPEFYNDHQMSLRAGRPITLDGPPPTLCDALMTPRPGALTFPINQANVETVFTASDAACLLAMGTLLAETGLTAEPGGAVALAALLSGTLDDYPDIKTVCIILSGGNVDAAILARAKAMIST